MLGGASTIGADLDAMTEVTALIEARAVRSVFQPIVRLDTREVVAYEALARGPSGTRWESPVELFCAAAAIGRTGELDWVCRARAYQEALAAGLDPAVPLFVNVDPGALGTPCPDDLRAVVERAHARLTVVAETTERAVFADPLTLLRAAATARSTGCGVAVDDLGADAAALALLSLVRPDVVKLDGYLLRRSRRLETSRVVTSVAEYAERAGAAVLAEAVETERQLTAARGMGATLGQGWLLGRPGPLPAYPAVPLDPLRLPGRTRTGGDPGATPYDVVAAERPVTLTTKTTMLAASRYLEVMALDEPEPTVVLACFQDAGRLAGGVLRRLAALAGRGALVAAFGVGMPDEPAAGVRGVRLAAGDLLSDEWCVIVLGPHRAAALAARDLGDHGPDAERRFVHAVTHDRELVAAAGRSLLRSLVPAATPAGAVAQRGGRVACDDLVG